MHLIENITKLKHRTFGVGTYKKHHDASNAIIIQFANGEKIIAMEAFDKGLISVIEDDKVKEVLASKEEDNNDINTTASVKQYDSSEIQIGGKNLIQAFSSNVPLMFNESYTIIGDDMKSEYIRACYNLTIIGNVNAKEIEVKGNLTVLGDIKAEKINCNNNLLCEGNIIAEHIEVGNDLIVESIKKCKNLYCGGKLIAKKSMDINDTEVEDVVFAGEGIVGTGKFSSKSAVAVDYFDFNGEIKGKIYDLDLDTVYGEERRDNKQSFKQLSCEEIIETLKEAISNKIISCGENGEDDILNFTKKLEEINIACLNDWHYIFKQVIDISYSNEIDNLRDYLILFCAKKILPKEIINYESVEHIFKQPYEDAVVLAEDLPFFVNSIEELILSLNIVSKYGDEINIDQDKAYDKIFQSVGIKYNTVKSFIINK